MQCVFKLKATCFQNALHHGKPSPKSNRSQKFSIFVSRNLQCLNHTTHLIFWTALRFFKWRWGRNKHTSKRRWKWMQIKPKLTLTPYENSHDVIYLYLCRHEASFISSRHNQGLYTTVGFSTKSHSFSPQRKIFGYTLFQSSTFY